MARQRGLALVVVLCAAVLNAAEQEQQTTYDNAEDAVAALAAALQKNDRDDLLGIFGRQYEERLTGGDEGNAKENLRIVGRAMRTRSELIDDGRNKKVLARDAAPVLLRRQS